MSDEASACFGERIPAPEPTAFAVDSPAGEPGLSFRIELPREWKQIEDIPAQQLADDRVALVAAFGAPDGASIQAFATLIPYEVNLEDWLLIEACEHEFALSGGKSVETAWGQAVHAEGTAANGALLRLLATGNGPYVMLVIGRMDPGEPAPEREPLGPAVASFAFTHCGGLKTREELCWHVEPDGAFRVAYPKSWSLSRQAGDPPGKSGIELRMTDPGGADAHLRIAADSRFALDADGKEEISRSILGEFEESGFLVESLETLPPEADIRGERWVGYCEREGRRSQLALWFRPAKGHWLTASMLCPLNEDSARGWMRGKRAFELAAGSIERATDSSL
jgi:hypothetical protein